MIGTYGYSVTGTSHIRIGMPCQDSHKIKILNDGMVIAAVADGVGSAAHSEVGAQTAVNTAIDYCERNIDRADKVSVIKNAYTEAMLSIERIAAENDTPLEDYDTTLSLVIYNGSTIVYGHSGDGGIMALNSAGQYEFITQPQKGADMISVIPLRAGERYWDIGELQGYSSVILMTDGILDVIKPYLLRQTKNIIYIPLAMMLGDCECYRDAKDMKASVCALVENKMSEKRFTRIIRNGLKAKYDDKTAKSISRSICRYKYPLTLMSSVVDDKTVVGLVNFPSCAGIQEPQYYEEADWISLQAAWNRLAYPHLYKEKEESDTEGTEQTNQ